MAGTLTLPADKNFTHVVVLISGSGPQDRNEHLAGIEHRPFLVLSDYLTRQGIAVLRYDDRGIGESTGDFRSATTADFATDAAGAVAYLRSRADFKGKKIGLAGHSEGGMIAPMVAAKHPVDFIALLAGPGIPIDELLLLQMEQIAKAEGAPEEMTQLNLRVMRNVYTYMKDHPGQNEQDFLAGVTDVFTAGLKQYPDSIQQQIGDPVTFIEGEVKEVSSPWFRYFITFEPAHYLSQVTCPVLAINGELDAQVPAAENLEGIQTALKKAGNHRVTTKALPGQNHLFQVATTGAPSEYGKIEETFNASTMAIIADWIGQQ